MRHRDIHDEAAEKREALRTLLETSEELDHIAALRSTPAWAVLERILRRHVETWEKGGAWGSFDDEAKREQGKALRSRELLEYFRSAEEEAKRLRAEAERLTTLLETAADQGRISRV